MVAKMARVRPVRRRLVAIVAVVPLVLAAAVAAGGPSQAASFLQSAGVSVSVAGGQAFTSTPTTVTFKVTNNPTNTASLAAFTLVVPKGIGVVRPLGVTVPANWREVVVPCGSSRSCSSLVLVYGTGPPAPRWHRVSL